MYIEFMLVEVLDTPMTLDGKVRTLWTLSLLVHGQQDTVVGFGLRASFLCQYV